MKSRHRRIVEALPILSVVFLVWTISHCLKKHVRANEYRHAWEWEFDLPKLLAGLALTTLPILLAVWLRRRFERALPEGYCPVCDYDLRATPDRCPECGTAVAADPEASMPPSALDPVRTTGGDVIENPTGGTPARHVL